MNHKDFISKSKTMLIAPAGYGKTHLIIECLNHTEGRQLILTHTHAGVGSINQKIKNANLTADKFHVETIAGYAQKYMRAYYTGTDIPDRKNSEAYYSFVINKAKTFIALPIISKIIKSSYTGLFVDEYQDCTMEQHEFICLLSEILPTRILGDPLQGIFNFNGSTSMVNLNHQEQMGDFYHNQFKLDVPWRWKSINESLGTALKDIRFEIESLNSFDLQKYPAIEYIQVNDTADLYVPGKKYYKDLSQVLKEESLLIIHPMLESIHPRKKVIKSFKIPIRLIESIDDNDFYDLAAMFDNVEKSTVEEVIHKVCLSIFNKTEVNKWISEKGPAKRTKQYKDRADTLITLFQDITKSGFQIACVRILKYIDLLENVRCYRKELMHSLCGALEASFADKCSVQDAMIAKRNIIRRTGRKVYGRCIGTTLLTKGLEFDTVVVLNAHEFDCPKNLYVALTRASKRLIVFGNSSILTPTY